MASGIAKWLYRHSSQSVCPYNVRFAQVLPGGSPFAPREVLAGQDARQLARDLLGIPPDEFSRAFKGSPLKRARCGV